ncbi:MAG: hypothetical protein WAL05_14830 [Candidatus Sulfotelmatobacter sp.]
MVFIIIGPAQSARNTLGRLLAEALGWEFVDAEDLHPLGNFDAGSRSTSLADADRISPMKTLTTAINFWIYEWRDIVVSCPALTENDRRQLSQISSLVKIVSLEASLAACRSHVSHRSDAVISSQVPTARRTACGQGQDSLSRDSSPLVEEIIADLTAVLFTSSCHGHN